MKIPFTNLRGLFCLACILFSCLTIFGQQPVLRHSYTFDDGLATDKVGGANGIIRGGAQLKDGKFITSEPGQYLELPAALIKINTFKGVTLEAYLVAGHGNRGYTMLSYFGSKIEAFGMDYIFQSLVNGGGSKTAISCYNISERSWFTETLTKGPPIDDGKLHHVVTTFDDKRINFYIDGMKVASSTNEAFPKNVIKNLGQSVAYLCKSGFEGDDTWLGSIDQFNIYEGVMDADAIARAAKAFVPEPDLAILSGNAFNTNLAVDQTGEFDQPINGRAIFFAEVIPSEDDGNNRVDELLVFSDVPMVEWSNFSTMVRFSGLSGYVDVYDADHETHDKATRTPVELGQVYQCWILVDVPANTYSLFVKTNEATTPVQIYGNARFRKKVSALTRWSIIHNREIENDALALKAFAKVEKIGDYPNGFIPSKGNNSFSIAGDKIAEGAKVINDPKYGIAFGPMQVKKIVRTDSTTELYFHTPYPQGWRLAIPKETFITEAGSSKKLFIKNAKGISIDAQHFASARGYLEFKLIFPAVADTTKYIDYIHSNEQGNWSLYNIAVQEQPTHKTSVLTGNWFNHKTGDWELSILNNTIIYQNEVWHIRHIPRDDKGILELERNGAKLTLPYTHRKGKIYLGTKGDLKMLSKEASYANVQSPTNPPPFKAPLLKMDTAVLKGYLSGYVSRVGTTTSRLYINNAITGEQEIYLIKIEDNGFFSTKVPLACPSVPYWVMEFGSATVLLSPGEETFVMFDLSRKTTPLFMGANARISSELSQQDLQVKTYHYNGIYSKILDMSAWDFRDYCLQKQTQDIVALDSIYQSGKISHRYYQYMKRDIEVETARNILHYHFTYEGAYRSAHNIPSREPIPVKIERPETPSYYHFITNELVNSEISMITHSYENFLNAFRYCPLFSGFEVNNDLAALTMLKTELTEEESQFVQQLEKSDMLELEHIADQFFRENGHALNNLLAANPTLQKDFQKDASNNTATIFWEYVRTNAKNLTKDETILLDKTVAFFRSPSTNKYFNFLSENGEKLNALRSKYAALIQAVSSTRYIEKRDSTTFNLLSIHPGLASDLILSQTTLGVATSHMTPLDHNTISYVGTHFTNPFFSNYFRTVNDAIFQKIESAKNDGGYLMHPELKKKADEVFDEIVGRFKGKVVYVDFWATWCGPCRTSITGQKPMKEQLLQEGKDVVFVYITNETSPENTYKNIVPTIPGEHFRLNSDQWSYVVGKFNISGIPHYALVNKKGKVVDPDAPGDVSTVKKRIEELLTEGD